MNVYVYEKIFLSTDIFKALLKSASQYAKKNILRKNTYKDKCSVLVNDFLLRKYVFENYGVKYNVECITKNRFGKPVFKKLVDCYFNFSHSDKYVAIVLSKNPVGIDISSVKCINSEAKSVFVSKKDFFSGKDFKKSLCKIWTAKESYVKARGCGLNICPKKISVVKNKNYFKVQKNNEKRNWIVKHTDLTDEVIIAVCSLEKFTLNCKIIDVEKLFISI